MRAAEAPASTEELILQAANRCFLRFGIRRTTMEDVAREARVSRGSVYRYFKDKDALVTETMLRNSGAFFDDLRQRMARKQTFEAKLAEAAVMARAYRDSDPVYAGLAATEPETLAVMLTTQAEQFIRRAIEFLVPLVDEAKRAGEMRRDVQSDRAAEWVVRVILSLITTPSVTFDLDDATQLRRFVADHIVKGLSA